MSVTVNKTRLPKTEWKTASGSIVSVDDARIRDAKSLIVRIDPVQEGSGDPSPDNERPITGWTGIKLYNDPKYGGLVKWNQLLVNGNFANGKSAWSSAKCSMSVSENVATCTLTDVSTVRWDVKIQQTLWNESVYGDIWYCTADVMANHEYGLTLAFTNCTFARITKAVKTASPTEWTRLSGICRINTGSHHYAQIYLGDDYTSWAIGDWFKVRNMWYCNLTKMFGSTVAQEFYDMEVSEAGSGIAQLEALFPQSYYPYNSGEEMTVSEVNGDPFQALSITVPSDVGTVYSARWDLITGEMVVDRAMIILTGASGENWYTYDPSNYNSFCFCLDQPDKRIKAMTSICNRFANVNVAWGAGGDGKYGVFSDHVNLARWYFRQPGPDIDTIQKWREWLSENPLQVCYELAAPIVYNVAPNRVPMFHKSNNIWANAGPVEVTYAAIKDHQQ